MPKIPKTIAERVANTKIAARCGWYSASKLIPLLEETFNDLLPLQQSSEGELKENISDILRKLMKFQETRDRIPKAVFERVKNPKRLQFPTFTEEDFAELVTEETS